MEMKELHIILVGKFHAHGQQATALHSEKRQHPGSQKLLCQLAWCSDENVKES